ncbi:hypothetical protein [Paralabilibaculum antarcticum]|nr:hypothetical protein [Labilibaculum sp. DW002]
MPKISIVFTLIKSKTRTCKWLMSSLLEDIKPSLEDFKLSSKV